MNLRYFCLSKETTKRVRELFIGHELHTWNGDDLEWKTGLTSCKEQWETEGKRGSISMRMAWIRVKRR